MEARSDILKSIESAANPAVKTMLVADLWKHAQDSGTPIISQKDGACEATFLYQSKDPSLHLTLKSEDLHDKLLSADGKLREFTQIPGTDIYYIKISDSPANACAAYTLTSSGVEIDDLYNKNNQQVSKYDISAERVVEKKECYMKMPDARLPDYQLGNKAFSIKTESFHSENPAYADFASRDIHLDAGL